MKQFLRFLILLVWVIGCDESYGSHVAGCDIQYSYRSKDSIDLTITMYKDCKSASLAAPTLNVVGIGCNYSASYSISSSACSDITPVCKKSCSKCDANSCNANGYPNGANASCTFPYGFEKLIYYKTIDLSGTNCCKLRFEISSASRNGAITTCCTSATLYSYAEIDRCNAPQNTSPILSNNPIKIMCVGNCMGIDLGGIDTTDYDSISYHLSPALYAYGSSCTYTGSYTYQYPLYYDGFPGIKKYNSLSCKGFSLDSNTGILNFKPMQQQVAIVAMDIKEWRRDSTNTMVQIGLTRRDVEFIIVANCTNKAPSLPSTSIRGCAGDLVCVNGVKSSDPDKKDTVRLQYYSNIPGAKFTAKYNNSGKQEFDFCWQTDSNDTLNSPYYFTVIATDDACPISGSYSRVYTVTLGSRKPIATHKVTHIACGKVKLESPNSNAGSKDSFIYTWTVSGKKYIGKDTAVDYNYDSSNIIQLDIDNNGCTATYYDTLYNLPKRLKLGVSADTAVCKGSPVTMRVKASDGFKPYKYIWNTGNTKDTFDNYTFNVLSNSQLYCKVIDSLGCEKNAAVNINIFKNAYLYAGPDATRCLGDTIRFDAGTPFISYRWLDSNNNILSKTRYLYTPNPGKYIVIVVDKNGCSSSDSVTAFIRLPKPVHVPTQRKCDGDTIIFDAGPNFTSYKWRDYGTNYIIAQTRTLNAVVNQKFVINTTDSNTCVASDTFEAIFNPVIVLSKQFASTVCQYDTIKLQAWGADNIIWRNILDTNLLYAGDTFYHSFDTSTKLVLKGYTTTGGVTCSASDTIVINTLPSPKITLQSKYIVCPGDKVTIQIGRQKQYTYLWNTGDKNDYIYTSQVGKYTVTAADTNGCKTSLSTSLENFTPPNLNLYISNDTLYTAYKTSQSYTWNRDNIFDVVTANPWFYVTQTGNYKVIVKDTNGCSDTSAVYKVSALKSGIEAFENITGIKIYPNPSTGIYNIESIQAINDITIYDLMGRKVYNTNSNNYNTIDLSSQPEGIFLLQINKNIWVRLSKL